ncbi:MAG: hypothetical protein QOJ63_2833 [Solirubrobacteraceae bacterium]|jgi:hypothetical protein|nr:hypothetical protein [Solirubrobacteraceae bacterium]
MTLLAQAAAAALTLAEGQMAVADAVSDLCAGQPACPDAPDSTGHATSCGADQ